jgi:hypothetical protein
LISGTVLGKKFKEIKKNDKIFEILAILPNLTILRVDKTRMAKCKRSFFSNVNNYFLKCKQLLGFTFHQLSYVDEFITFSSFE